MSSASPLVQEFFDRYAQSRTARDIVAIVSQYPDACMFAGPNGARVTERAAILAAFPKGEEFLTALGHTSTRVLTLDENRLDHHYAMVRARFAWRFERQGAQPIDVHIDSTFILHLGQHEPTIVFQHEHDDFQQALRASGVLPAAS